jgi:uncharacterized protein (DUF1778 family)
MTIPIKGGQPRRKKHLSKATIALRCTVSERAAIRKAARFRGMTVSALLRAALKREGILEGDSK